MASKDLIDTIIAEAGGGGKEGITAATWAIAQRAAARGQTMDQVIRSGFDGFTNPGSGSRKAQQNQALRNQVAQIISGVQQGSIPNPVPGADHFLSGNVNPSWARNMRLVATIDGQRYYASGQVPKSAQGIGLPPGEVPNAVGTLTDTVPPRAVPPATISPSMAAIRSMTSPSGGDTALQQALGQYAQRQANQVTPAIRRPALPPMGTPNVNSLYAGIYPQATQGSLTNPGAIDASVNSLKQNTALQSALNRSINAPATVSQSQIERTRLPIAQSQIERTALPENVPSNLISQSFQNIASANPTKLPTIAVSSIGQPPSTRSVQSVAMPALGSVASRTPPRVTVSTPNTIPQRMAAQDIGNVPRALPQSTPFVPEQRYEEPRNISPVAPYQGPFVPDKGLERLSTPTALSFNPIQQPPPPQTQAVQVLNPAWSALPAIPAAGTPMSGGLSRDAVALRAKGLAQAQAMANVPKFITVQRPVQVPVRIPAPVQQPISNPLRLSISGAQTIPQPLARPAAMTPVQALQAQGLTAAQAYARLTGGSGSNSDAASRVNGSNTRGSGGARSLMD